MRSAFDFESHGEVTVKGYHWYNEGQTPTAAVVLSHGMAEHIMRYEAFAEYLLAAGYTVFGHDHRGHGETVESEKSLGYLGKNGWSKMVDDLTTVIRRAKNLYPDTPVILFGHSMGSYVSRDLMTRSTQDLSGVILSGTGFPSAVELKVGKWIAQWEQRIKGADKPSKRLDKMSFGKFNSGFPDAKTPFDWLSRDEAVVKAYINDPYCGNLHPSSFFSDMTHHMYRILYVDPPKLGGTLPVYIFSGAKDPVGENGKGVEKTADFYKKAGCAVTLKLYPDGRHEMLNEVNRLEVFKDVVHWIEKQIS